MGIAGGDQVEIALGKIRLLALLTPEPHLATAAPDVEHNGQVVTAGVAHADQITDLGAAAL
jgi:hypothetical protein